ncbi:MAG: hypothetical protein KAQ97_06680 [Candidatus Fermentibacteraceae bacterium]|nr:hypothetical protein [Candidatus Fermentibacteraceae bacterium]
MLDFLSRKNNLYAIILSVVILVVSVAVKYINVLYMTPSRIQSELNEVYEEVKNIHPVSLRKVEFLIKWGEYRNSDECSNAVYQSLFETGSGFEGNVYVVSYPDSIEFPGLPNFHRQFRIEKPMG